MPDNVIELKKLKQPIRIKNWDKTISKESYTHIVARWVKHSPYYDGESSLFIQPMRIIGTKVGECIYAFNNTFMDERRNVPLMEVESVLENVVKGFGDKDIVEWRY